MQHRCEYFCREKVEGTGTCRYLVGHRVKGMKRMKGTSRDLKGRCICYQPTTTSRTPHSRSQQSVPLDVVTHRPPQVDVATTSTSITASTTNSFSMFGSHGIHGDEDGEDSPFLSESSMPLTSNGNGSSQSGRDEAPVAQANSLFEEVFGFLGSEASGDESWVRSSTVSSCQILILRNEDAYQCAAQIGFTEAVEIVSDGLGHLAKSATGGAFLDFYNKIALCSKIQLQLSKMETVLQNNGIEAWHEPALPPVGGEVDETRLATVDSYLQYMEHHTRRVSLRSPPFHPSFSLERLPSHLGLYFPCFWLASR